MKLPIVVRLPDGQVRIYDAVQDVLHELRAEGVANGDYKFYDCEGHRLRAEMETVRRERRLLGIVPVVSNDSRLKVEDYSPPLERVTELDTALRDYVSWPGFQIAPEWVAAATLDDLIARARRLLW